MTDQTVEAESETLILITCFPTGRLNSHLTDCSVNMLAHIAHRLGKKKRGHIKGTKLSNCWATKVIEGCCHDNRRQTQEQCCMRRKLQSSIKAAGHKSVTESCYLVDKILSTEITS